MMNLQSLVNTLKICYPDIEIIRVDSPEYYSEKHNMVFAMKVRLLKFEDGDNIKKLLTELNDMFENSKIVALYKIERSMNPDSGRYEYALRYDTVEKEKNV